MSDPLYHTLFAPIASSYLTSMMRASVAITPQKTASNQREYMTLALHLAAQGELTCAPNPQVGCVIVRQGHIVGQGYHHRAGEPHAEVHALQEAQHMAEGADVYVTLEPCSHQGRTPPCVDALIKARVARVIIPFADPHPRVSGQGIAKLKQAGIDVITGVLATEAAWQNRLFLTAQLDNKPYIIAKWAMTTAGELTHPSRRWISNEASRQHAHLWRQRVDAVMVGKGTVLSDNPALTNRAAGLSTLQRRHPLRLIISRSNVIPALCGDKPCQLSHPGLPGETWWISPGTHTEPLSQPHRPGLTQWQLPSSGQLLLLPTLFSFLATQHVASVLVEGGPQVLAQCFEAGLVDEAHIYIDAIHAALPKSHEYFWHPLAYFQKRDEVHLDDNIWLQYAKSSDLASRLLEKTENN